MRNISCTRYLGARFFLVAIRVLAVKLHVANEVLERLATFLERSSPSTVFGVLFDDLGVKLVLVAPFREETAVVFLSQVANLSRLLLDEEGPSRKTHEQ